MSDIVKNYINKNLQSAASSIKLKNDGIEILALLKNFIIECNDLEIAFSEMKKVTELARIAIRFNTLYNYITSDKIDFTTLSNNFKTQKEEIVPSLSYLFNTTSPARVKILLDEIVEIVNQKLEEAEAETNENDSANMELETEQKTPEVLTHSEYVNAFVNTIKELNIFLDVKSKSDLEINKIGWFVDILREKMIIAANDKLDIIVQMFEDSIEELNSLQDCEEKYFTDKIEYIRSMMIISVAFLKCKEVDICYYMDRIKYFKHKFSSDKRF